MLVTHKISIILINIFFLSACAFGYVDDQNRTHMIGFGDFVIDNGQNNDEITGRSVVIEHFGLAFIPTDEGYMFNLGYVDFRNLYLHDDRLVIGNPFDHKCYTNMSCREKNIQNFKSSLNEGEKI